MNNIYQLDDYRKEWLYGIQQCSKCRHESCAIFHKDLKKYYQCPQCAEMTAEILMIVENQLMTVKQCKQLHQRFLEDK